MHNIKGILEIRKISQLELSRLTRISPSDISAILNNKKYPFKGWRTRIAQVLGIPETELFPDYYRKEV